MYNFLKKGEAGTGNVQHAVLHARNINQDIKLAASMDEQQLRAFSKKIQVSFHLLQETAKLGRLPVVTFSAGGLATPADVAMLMQLGVDGVFVGSGIFKSNNPEKRARAMVLATTHYNNPIKLAEISEDLGAPMVGIGCDETHENWSTRESGAH